MFQMKLTRALCCACSMLMRTAPPFINAFASAAPLYGVSACSDNIVAHLRPNRCFLYGRQPLLPQGLKGPDHFWRRAATYLWEPQESCGERVMEQKQGANRICNAC